MPSATPSCASACPTTSGANAAYPSPRSRPTSPSAARATTATAAPANDAARMAAFNEPDALARTLFIGSLSNVFAPPGVRMVWQAFPNPTWAGVLPPDWNNATADLPAEWQLRYLAY